MRIKKNLFLGIVLTFVVISAGIFLLKQDSKNTKPPCPNCNILLISIGTVSANHLPCYDYHRNTAPNLCKFAKENIYFENFFAQSNFTLEGYISMLTSLLPSTHNTIVAYKDRIHPDKELLPEILQKNDYNTIYLGPENDPTIPLSKGFDRGFDQLITSDDSYSDLKIQWEKLNNYSEIPTFMFFHSYGAHAPYTLPEEYGQPKFAANFQSSLPLTDKDYKKFSEDFLEYAVISIKDRIEKSDTEESL